MTERSRRITLIVVAAALSPLTLLTAFLALSIINPMGLVFLTTFTVVNESGNDVWVTPIGAIGEEGRRATLPYSRFRNLDIPSSENRDFHIAPESSRSLIYDWDDIQFAEILVRNQDGDYRILSTGLHPTEGQYRAPQQKRFIVEDLSRLDFAGPVHLKALETDNQRLRIVYGLALIGLLPPVLLYFAFRRRRPARAEHGTAQSC